MASLSQTEPLHQILYRSRLAAGNDFSVVKEIVHIARKNNPQLQVTGALLFDGEWFCQLLEGPSRPVLSLADRIQKDTRHSHFELLYSAPSGSARLMSRWSCGYCDPDSFDIFDAGITFGGHEAMHAFLRIVAAADMSD